MVAKLSFNDNGNLNIRTTRRIPQCISSGWSLKSFNSHYAKDHHSIDSNNSKSLKFKSRNIAPNNVN